jgi:hypothetical protein
MNNVAVLDYSDGNVYIYNIMNENIEEFLSERHELDQINYMVTEYGINIYVRDNSERTSF